MWIIDTDQGTVKPAVLITDWENGTTDIEAAGPG